MADGIPATLKALREELSAMRDELGELGGELLHRSDSDREVWESIRRDVDRINATIEEVLRDLARIRSRLPVRKADKRGRRAVHQTSQK